jgi:hypothetical protein
MQMNRLRDPSSLPTADQVRELLTYDPETGVLTWLPRRGDGRATKSWNAKHAGKQAGTPESNYGYVQVGLFGRIYLAHRIILLLATSEWPPTEVDHVNGIRTDNRIANLRLATPSQNQANRKRPATNTSKFKGVTWDRGRYKAQIIVRGKYLHLGHFATPEDAHAAYCSAARAHFGQFARAA